MNARVIDEEAMYDIQLNVELPSSAVAAQCAVAIGFFVTVAEMLI